MKISALINADSGSTPGDSESLLRAALEEMGLAADVQPVEPHQLRRAVDSALQTRPDALIMWGGDGSIACALSASGPSGPPVLALPGGTMNLVHKRLHGDVSDWKAILQATLANPVSRPFAAGCVGERQFYVAAMVGKVTNLAAPREAARRGELLKAAEMAVQADAMSVERRLTLLASHGEWRQAFNAVAAAIVVGAGQEPKLEVAAIDPNSTLDWLAIAFDALIHGWREAESIDLDETRTVQITDVEGLVVPATIDGEVLELPSGATVTLKRHAANVLRARPA
ncbi:diacylglycerol/lipid kinase family protein [Hyphomonas johnsonii]|uniref:DAGKc domain-containing protein n=1 Tax=Hyphomonas johnsonii MHS-2 TaxID=1280950 RepID=A0A059FTB3_9PROT|nr:diacylglycerol kinase family protein [Hyphomonas johnsonii]KCZ93909.1 hypothetical protein HJO_01000 [Hyphomonas johnsonii MHS-2]